MSAVRLAENEIEEVRRIEDEIERTEYCTKCQLN